MRKLFSLFAAVLMAVSVMAVDIASMSYTKKGADAPADWTISGTNWSSTGNYVFVCSDGSITSPDINWDNFSSVTITATVGRYGSLSGSKATLAATVNGTAIGSVDGTSTTPSAQTYASFTMPTGTYPIVFTCSNATSTAHGARVTAITITGTPKGGGVSVEGVSLNETSVTIIVGKIATLEATITPANADNKNISWESDDDEVATVTNGVVRGVAVGSTIVTVTTEDGNKTATCNVNVIAKPAPVGAIFYESFDNFDGQGGNDNNWSGTLTMKNWGTNATDVSGWTTEGLMQEASECAGIRKSTASTGGTDIPSGLTTPAIGVAGKGHVQFDAESWGTDGSNFFVDIVGGGTWVADENLVAGNISNDGTTAKVIMAKNGTFTTFDLQFEGLTATSKLRFYAPAGKRAFLDEVAIWVTPAPETLSMNLVATDGNFYYATFSSEYAWVVPANLVVSEVSVVDGELYIEDYATSDVVPANTGVLVAGEAAGEYTVEVETDPETLELAESVLGEDNMLRPASVAKEAEGYLFYKLAYGDAELTPATLGFYWGAENGAAFTSREGSAYLAVPATLAPARFLFNSTEEVTALENVAAVEGISKKVVNGRLFILRDGKTFDVVGRIVK